MIADSSSDGSIDRSAATISRKTSGARCSPSTQIIPGIEYRLKACPPSSGLITHWLPTPLFGSRTNVHAIVCRIPGMISGTSDAANISGLPGTSVRTIR